MPAKTAISAHAGEWWGYGNINAIFSRSRAQFARAHEALSLARPDPHAPGILKMRGFSELATGFVPCHRINGLLADRPTHLAACCRVPVSTQILLLMRLPAGA